MINHIAAILIIALLPIQSVFAQSADTVEITQGVSPTCGDGVCEAGEDFSSCPVDCPVAVPTATPPAPAPGQFFRDIFPPRITDIQTQLTHNSAIITWKTSEPALSQFLWGKTTEYEREAIMGQDFIQEHRIIITGLEPATKYHFMITAEDKAGNIGRTSDLTFTTSALPDLIPPANVSNFKAELGDKQITLTWKNPPDEDFAGVKIMRSTFFYPQDPLDGLPVYNGKGEFFIDTEVENGVRYYYTAFTYDTSGNFSSGAVASAVPQPPEIPPVIPPPPEIMPPGVPVPPELEALTLEDFEFWQEGKELPLENARLVRVKIGQPLTIVLAYEKVPETLKTIMLTLEKPKSVGGSDPPTPKGVVLQEAQASVWEELSQREFFSFLLRVNPEKTRYEATIMPPDEVLTYPLFATVLDFKHQVRKRLEGELQTIMPPPPPLKPWWKEPRSWRYLLYILFTIAVISAVLRRKRKRKQIINNQ